MNYLKQIIPWQQIFVLSSQREKIYFQIGTDIWSHKQENLEMLSIKILLIPLMMIIHFDNSILTHIL